MSRHIYRQLLKKRAVDIGVGSFAVVPVLASVAEDKVLPVERPMFILSKSLKMFYNLESDDTKIPDETPVVPPDVEEVAASTHFRHEIVEQCVQETLLCFAGALRDNREVEFSFKGIGILAVRNKVVSTTFLDGCLLELDTTGNMLKALLEDPKIMNLVAFPGQNDFSRISQDEVLSLPSLVVETPHQPLAPLVSLKPRRESAPWGGGSRRLSVLDPVFLARRRVSQASQQSMEVDLARDKETGQIGYLPVIPEKTQRKPKRPTSPAQQGLKVSASAPQPSELPLYSEKEERELQLLLASKRRELEAEVWRKYFGNRAITRHGQVGNSQEKELLPFCWIGWLWHGLCAVPARSSPLGAPSPARLPLWAKLRQEPRLLRQCLRRAPCAFADLLPLRVRGSLSPCPRPEEGLRRAAEGEGEIRAVGRAPALEENPGGVSEVEGGPAAGPPEERDGLSTGPGPASLSQAWGQWEPSCPATN
ncbi:coiled-coil domain-containing protein 81-like [Catharus ustulatus]|uniref:coiled-coil domain-containing protein 81-like n=1 Tax=Catharus ustulatus TaxID=91951 RepID=UPI00140E1C67|nr:coiled-coil domain-containing protein 81-like [Catharus ustulatus]